METAKKVRVREKKFETVINDNGDKVTLICVRPNQDVLDGARLEYNVTFAKAIRAGCLMRVEAEEIIEKRKLWSPDHEAKLQTMRLTLRQLEIKLLAKPDLDTGKEIAIQMAATRNSINELVLKRNDLFNRTAESLADAAQNQYLIVRCILQENRQPYFTSLEKFKEMESTQLLGDCLSELTLFLMDINSDDILATPENKWLADNKLKDPKTGFWVKDGRFYTDDDKEVDSEGNYIKDGQFVDEFGYVLNSNTTTTENNSMIETVAQNNV